MYEHDPLTHQIIGCAIEVHRHLGPGLLEATYEKALCIELAEGGLAYTRQVPVPVLYKGHLIGEHRPDLVVCDRVLVEIKSVEAPHGAPGADLGLHAGPAGADGTIDELQQRSIAHQRSKTCHLNHFLGASVPRCPRDQRGHVHCAN